ncbi:MAG: UDP-glucose 4-epimerase GalE [Gammaproteobacteria bacterium]|nr:MAG: UDP-glucose 4-epimerase GalE [Gammaproteobacteria bacterium]
MSKNILVTGGAGYIGSHTCLELLEDGYNVVVIDNLSNSSKESLTRVGELTGKNIDFIEGDIRNQPLLEEIMQRYSIGAVVHFAGLKAVGESVEKPLEYFENNVGGTISLCKAMANCGVKNLVFSSSATVYGDPHTVPITEDFPLSATNPYGRSKLHIEEMLRDLYVSDNSWNVALLRYFNPVGAHSSGKIGEDPNGIPNNLVPYITQVAVGRLEQLSVFGDDYNTKDGTGVRDYIHVVDLAKGHLKAIEALAESGGVITVNLGTGTGYSVLEMVEAFRKATGKDIPCKMAPRRAGDIAECYANPANAAQIIGWKAELGIDDMAADSWRWQKNNPNGYGE